MSRGARRTVNMKGQEYRGRGGLWSQFAAFGLFGLSACLMAAGIALLVLSGEESCRALLRSPFGTDLGQCLPEGWYWLWRGLAYGLGGGVVVDPAPALSLLISGPIAFLMSGLLGMFRRWRGFLVFLLVEAILTGVWAVLGYLRHYIF